MLPQIIRQAGDFLWAHPLRIGCVQPRHPLPKLAEIGALTVREAAQPAPIQCPSKVGAAHPRRDMLGVLLRAARPLLQVSELGIDAGLGLLDLVAELVKAGLHGIDSHGSARRRSDARKGAVYLRDARPVSRPPLARQPCREWRAHPPCPSYR